MISLEYLADITDIADIADNFITYEILHLLSLESFPCPSGQFIRLILDADVDNLSPCKLSCQDRNTKNNERKAGARKE
jgi:hypothetical protein